MLIPNKIKVIKDKNVNIRDKEFWALKKEYKFFQISDAHMACLDEESSEADLAEYKRSHEQWDSLKIHYAERFEEFYDDRYQVEPCVLFEALTKHALEFGADA